MSKATEIMLDELHLITAATLADYIKNGVPVLDKESGAEVGRVPAAPAYIAAAIKFLKDNDITADSGSDRFDPVKDALNGIGYKDSGEDEYKPYN